MKQRKYIEVLGEGQQRALQAGITRRALRADNTKLKEICPDVYEHIKEDRNISGKKELNSYAIRAGNGFDGAERARFVFELMYKKHLLESFKVGIYPIHQAIRGMKIADKGNDTELLYGIGENYGLGTPAPIFSLNFIYVPDAFIGVHYFTHSRYLQIYSNWVRYMHNRFGANFVFLLQGKVEVVPETEDFISYVTQECIEILVEGGG